MSKQFLAIAFLVALVGTYALPGALPEDEFEWPTADELIQEQNDFVSIFAQEGVSGDTTAKLQAALGQLAKFKKGKGKALMGMLSTSSKKTHAQKLKATIATKSKIKTLVTGIQTTLKSEYKAHKISAQSAIDTIGNFKNGVTSAQFKPLVAGALNWCRDWKEQRRTLGVMGDKKKKMDTAKAAKIPSPPPIPWKDACPWGVSYKQGDSYSQKTFAATTDFQSKFNTARKAYWEATKAHFSADEDHTGDISTSNTAATAFKTSIKMLADFEFDACGKRSRQTQKTIVTGFNTANKKRAAVWRSLEVIHCHIDNLHHNANLKTKTDTCVATVKTEGYYGKENFPDLTVPDITCPSKVQVRANIQAKYAPKLPFHYKLPAKKSTSDFVATDPNGNLKADQGWVPTTAACKEVTDHSIKGQKCADKDCGSGKKMKTGVASKHATNGNFQSICCRLKTCSDWTCPSNQSKKSGVGALKPPTNGKCCENKVGPSGGETYLGCFDSPRNQHGYINDLPGGSKYVKMVSGKANPLKFCREQCASLGNKNGNKYTWYAIEYGGGCHCGTNFAGKTNKKKPDSACEAGGGYGIHGCKCGFPYYCGGAHRIAAYSMAVGSTAQGGRRVDKKWKAATCPNYKAAGGKQ